MIGFLNSIGIIALVIGVMYNTRAIINLNKRVDRILESGWFNK